MIFRIGHLWWHLLVILVEVLFLELIKYLLVDLVGFLIIAGASTHWLSMYIEFEYGRCEIKDEYIEFDYRR